ncbi:MAG: ester cyclase [Pseudomonadota bacterium]
MAARPPRPKMGIATDQTAKNKQRYKVFLDSFETADITDVAQACAAFFDDAATIDAAHPINESSGGSGYYGDIIAPMAAAFRGFQRRNDILIGGEYLGGEWVTSMGYFCGHFRQPWLGIAPSNRLEFIRFGEFHRMEAGKVVQSHVFLGIAEMIIAMGRWPLGASKGYEGLVPGPATFDGIQLGRAPDTQSRGSGDLVENMLMQLTSPDAAWRPYWHDDMFWFGPGGFGTYVTVDAFHDFQVPFEQTFEGWGDGRPDGIEGVGVACKAGDGDYAFLSGWPAITGVQVKPFMGIETTNHRVYLRDCDWWRCKDGKIVENWCMVDTLHLAMQLGRDVIAEIGRE